MARAQMHHVRVSKLALARSLRLRPALASTVASSAPPADHSPADIRRVARDQFGHPTLRPGQERVIRSLLAGRDVLGILPTGGGKSLVYQVASQLLPGLTVVVSPLLALMKDQTEALDERVEAAELSSAQSGREEQMQLQRIRRGETRLLFVTPERFANRDFVDALRQRPVSLLAVDEAHCVSQWGHDFRPAYLELAGVAESLGRPVLLALTATAGPSTRDEIVEALGLRDPDIVVRGLDRPNLFFEVRRAVHVGDDRRILEAIFRGEEDRYGSPLDEQLREAMQGSGIVYTRTTAAARETAAWLREWGVAADFYHGQRTAKDRDRVQTAFMSGDIRVVAATNAFGLGVDKPDVRFVLHRQTPAGLEEYFQEAGRAGRDGAFSRCTLIHRGADLNKAAFLSNRGLPSAEAVAAVRRSLVLYRPTPLSLIRAQTGLSRSQALRVVAFLDRLGVVRRTARGIRLLRDFNPEDLTAEQRDHLREIEQSRVQMMRHYAEGSGCRRRFILNYLGQEMDAKACLCDNHALGRVDCAEPARPDLTVGRRLQHATLGSGVVEHVENGEITVLFDDGTYRTLDVGFLEREGAIETG